MEKVENLINKESFSTNTLNAITRKKTEKGALKTLGTLTVFKEAYPDTETVFDKIFEARRMKSNDRCTCGSPISKFYVRIEGTYKYRCRSCNLRISPLAATPFKGFKIPLHTIIEITFKCIQSKHGYASKEIEKDYGLKYETSLNLHHKIMEWMGMVVNEYKFNNATVEGDETYVRVPTGLPRGFKFSRGLSSERIKPVITLIEQGGNAKAIVVDEVEKETLKSIYHTNVSLSSLVYTDGSAAYDFLSKNGYNHKQCNHSIKQWSNNGAHVNTAEGFHALIKGKIGTVHKGVSSEHLQKYVDEVCFVFSNRFKDPYTALNSLFDVLPPFIKKSNQ